MITIDSPELVSLQKRASARPGRAWFERRRFSAGSVQFSERCAGSEKASGIRRSGGDESSANGCQGGSGPREAVHLAPRPPTGRHRAVFAHRTGFTLGFFRQSLTSRQAQDSAETYADAQRYLCGHNHRCGSKKAYHGRKQPPNLVQANRLSFRWARAAGALPAPTDSAQPILRQRLYRHRNLRQRVDSARVKIGSNKSWDLVDDERTLCTTQ